MCTTLFAHLRAFLEFLYADALCRVFSSSRTCARTITRTPIWTQTHRRTDTRTHRHAVPQTFWLKPLWLKSLWTSEFHSSLSRDGIDIGPTSCSCTFVFSPISKRARPKGWNGSGSEEAFVYSAMIPSSLQTTVSQAPDMLKQIQDVVRDELQRVKSAWEE